MTSLSRDQPDRAGRKGTMQPVVNYQVGSKSAAGYPILFDGQSTLAAAREKADRMNLKHPGQYVFRVTVEQVDDDHQ